jgi:hypothetical protein
MVQRIGVSATKTMSARMILAREVRIRPTICGYLSR